MRSSTGSAARVAAGRAFRAGQRAVDRRVGRRVVHVLHVRKTGGTAVAEALRERTRPEGFSIVLRGHDATLGDVPEGDLVVFFLRDPVTRFASGFGSRQRKGVPRSFDDWTPGERWAFERFDTPNELGRALASIDPQQRRDAERAIGEISHLRTSYRDWLGDADQLRARRDDVLLAGRQERLTEDFDRLKTALGLPDDVRLPDDDVAAHRNPPTFDPRLDDVARAAVAEWYRADYEVLELCSELFGT